MPKKKEKKFTEDFVKKWKETTTDDEVTKAKRILSRQEELLKKHPKNVNLWFARGELLRSLGEHEKALRCYDVVIKLEPEHRAVYNARAEALNALGRRDEAVESYRRALEISEKLEEIPEFEPEILEIEDLAREIASEIDREPAPEEPAPEEELEEAFVCPMCGEPLDPDESRCPTCGTEFLEEVDEEEILERLETLESDLMDEEEPSPEEEAFRKKLEKWRREGYNVLPLEEVLQKEPHRSRSAFFQFEENLKKVEILRDSLESMPTEGHEEEIEKIELMLRSPYKIWAIEAEMESLWQKIEQEHRREVAPPDREVPPRVPPREGLINGRRREGMIPPGRINGLINGIESAKRGLINGLTNGVGMTNGLGSLRFRREEMLGRWKLFIPVVFALLLLSSSFFVSVEIETEGRIRIDGNIGDWSGIASFESAQSAGVNPNIDIVETAVYDDSGFLTFYVQVQGTMLQGNGIDLQDTIFVFIDMDKNGATGYRIGGLGADMMIEIFGLDNAVTQAILFEFDSQRGNDDWNGWFKPRTIRAEADSSYLEAEVDWRILEPNAIPIDVLFASHGYEGTQDVADLVVSNVGGSLKVVQRSYLSDPVVSGTDEVLLRLTMISHGGEVRVTRITAEMVGTAPPSDISTVSLLDGSMVAIDTATPSRVMSFDLDMLVQEGSSETLYLSVDTTSNSQDTVGMRILFSSDIRTESGSVTLDSEDPLNDIGLGYLGSIRTGYSIDGAFSEWVGTPATVPVGNPNIDIVSYASVNETDSLYFFVEVDGKILKGTALPYTSRQWVAPSPFIDSDIDSVPDDADGPNGTNVNRYDFDNDGTPDGAENQDVDSDGSIDYPAGPDWYLNTTIPMDYLPEYRGRVVSRYIGPVQRPPILGEDIVRAYIDTEPGVGYLLDSATGFYADFLLEISGKNGDPIRKRFLSFAGTYPGQWAWDPAGNVETEKDVNRLEASVDLTGIVLGPMFDVRFTASDWKGDSDSSRGTRYGTRGDFGEFDAISKGAYNVYFTESAREVKFEVEGNYLSWSLPATLDVVGEEAVAQVPILPDSILLLDENRAIHASPNDGGGNSILYEFGDRTLKETIMLDSPMELDGSAELLSLEFALDYSDNLLPFVERGSSGEVEEISTLDFFDGDRKVLSVLPPYAYDSDDERMDCTYSFTPSTKSLELSCDAEWFRDATFPVYIDPSVNYTLEDDSTYSTQGENFGRSIAVGDFNGDGYADILGGAPLNNYNSVTFRGLAHIYYGPFTANDNSPDVTILGPTTNDKLGTAVAAGRIDSDSYWDAVVTQTDTDSPPTYVYYGSSGWTGLETTPDVTISSEGGGFGDSLAVCNVDNSDYDDIIIGAPAHTTSVGRAFIYLSPLSSSVMSPDDTLAPLNAKNGRFGDSLSCGKIDDDDYYDVAVGEPYAEFTGSGKRDGRVSIFEGANIDFSAGNEVPDSVLEYEYAEEQFGTSVHVGKIDSDSYDDLIVGAQYNDEGGTDRGRAYVYIADSAGTGIGDGASPDVDIAGQSDEERFGFSVFAGNVMGSSVGEVVIGAPYADVAGTSRGAVYVFEDPVNDNATYDDKINGTQDGELLGWSLDGGQFSNDDIFVIAIGSPYWDDGGEVNEGRLFVWMIPEFPSEIVPIAFTLIIPIAMAYRRRRTT